ncbi:MAG: glycosyltransferase family 4 protein [Planctomycetes bacterium]|nr:glycosyltransferase family 4 protein [Planctomycetota bacterium]
MGSEPDGREACMRRLKVLVDYTFADSSGARTHAARVTPLLAADPGLTVSIARRADQPADLAGPGTPTSIVAPAWTRRAWLRVLWQQAALPGLARRLGTDVLFCPTDFAPLAARCPVVLLVRNLAAYRPGSLSGGHGTALRQWAMRSLTRLSARAATRTFFLSDASRREHGRWLVLPSGRASVIPHGRGEEFSPEPAGPREEILSVSSVYRFKNYLTLCRAIRQLVEAGVRVPPVRIVGRILDREAHEEIARFLREARLEARVTFAGEMRHAELPSAYRRARVFVLPSLLETFCHPVVESLASGTPTLVSDLPVLREICADGAAYFDPTEAGALASSLRRALEDPDWAAALARRGLARARAFSWAETARRTATLLKEAATCQDRRRAPPPIDPRRNHEFFDFES